MDMRDIILDVLSVFPLEHMLYAAEHINNTIAALANGVFAVY